GSGLTALAIAIAIRRKKVLVIAGEPHVSLTYYDPLSGIPSSNYGMGGLGSFWHGVIPTGHLDAIEGVAAKDFCEIFHFFYPGTDVDRRLHAPWLFVPYSPIRPNKHWGRLLKSDGTQIEMVTESAE